MEEVKRMVRKLGERFRGRKAGERYSIIWSLEEGGIEVFGWGSDKVREAKEIGREILGVTKVGVVEIDDSIDGDCVALLECE